MKNRNGAVLLITLLTFSLLTGCATKAAIGTLNVAENVLEQHLETAEEAVEQRQEKAENAAKKIILPEPVRKGKSPASSAPQLTPEEAQAIALKHAAFTADQVSRVHTEFEVDDRIPHYDVQFRQGRWEYEYEIHSETGVILSFEKDN